jgi:RNA polymerase sigma factor (sigma-70 family)
VGSEPLESLFQRYAQDGDEAASRELVERTRGRLLAVARRIGNPADAEDSVQTAYLSLLHKRDAPFDAPILPWLLTATVRIAYRAKAKRDRLLQIADRLARAEDAPSAADIAAASDEADRLRARVAELPASLRDVVVLHYFQGLPTREAAQLLGITPNAVKKRLARARGLLRSRLNARYTAWLLALPWWLADQAPAAIVGGLVMKKTAVVATILIVLAATTAGVTWRAQSETREREQARAADVTRADADPDIPAVEPEPETGVDQTEKPKRIGIVVTPDGIPVEGAEVRVGAYYFKSGGRLGMSGLTGSIPSVFTDADGGFTLKHHYRDQIADVEYIARASGYAWSTARVPLDDPARIVLQKGGTLRMAANLPADAKPEKTLFDIRQFDGKMFQNFVMESGKHAEVALPPGRYEVRVTAPHLTPAISAPVELGAGDERELTFTLTEGVVFDVEVVDPEGRPVPGAEVELNGPGNSGGIGKTDAKGLCRVSGIALAHKVNEGPYTGVTFQIRAEGFAPYRNTLAMPGSEGVEERRFELVRGARVVFRFVDEQGRALAKQRVYFFYSLDDNAAGTPYWKTTDDDGRVVFPALQKATVKVQILEREKNMRKIALTGEPQEIEVALRRPNATLTGTVLDVDGKPLQGGTAEFVAARLERKAPDGATRQHLKPDGTFELKDLEAGEGLLWVRAKGAMAQSFPVTVPSTPVTVRLRTGKMLAGVVVKRDDSPVMGIPVQVHRNFAGGAGWTGLGTVKTDAEGRFEFRCVEGDKLNLRVNDQDWIESFGLGYRASAGETDLRLRVKPRDEGWGLKIPIEVRDKAGRALDGKVEWIEYTRDGKRGRWHLVPEATETPGMFVLKYFDAPGTCDFKFRKRGYRPFELNGIVIVDRKEQPTLRLEFDRGAALRVIARHPDGSPFAGKVLTCGSESARTDAEGRVEFGGFDPGARGVTIHRKGDTFLHSAHHSVELPGTVEVVMRRRGWAQCEAAGEGPHHWKLIDAEGTVRDERTTERKWVTLYSTHEGPHRVVLTNADGTSEYSVSVRLGKNVKGVKN